MAYLDSSAAAAGIEQVLALHACFHSAVVGSDDSDRDLPPYPLPL